MLTAPAPLPRDPYVQKGLARLAELDRLGAKEPEPEPKHRPAPVPVSIARPKYASFSKLQRARQIGMRDGLHDRHYCPWLDFKTGEEYIAWLSGWRRGQARKAARP